ncbi:MAG: hypothetical protein MK135_11105 [Polyangiaceae bacterium]|nr:hypothetical protein [Polyangiaceae bacterium]
MRNRSQLSLLPLLAFAVVHCGDGAQRLSEGAGSSTGAPVPAENTGVSTSFGNQDGEADPDGDFIKNFHEGQAGQDADGDGIPNAEDEDSDGDGLTDAEEAGDQDLRTAPSDTDGDGIPDFLDADSDDDGLSDALEVEKGWNHLKRDSDEDGVDDLVEYGAGTDPNDPMDNPVVNGDFFFRVPYQAPPSPREGALVFEPEVRAADVYFLMDSSVSMNDPLQSVQNNLSDIIFPGIVDAITDVAIGAGEFDTCPNNQNNGRDGAGELKNIGIRHLSDPTSTTADVVDALENTFSHDANGRRTRPEGGPDEPYGPAMWLWATGDHTFGTGDIDAQVPGNTNYDPETDDPIKGLVPADCDEGRIGFGCMRDEALPLLVLIGDEPFNEGDKCDVHISKTPDEVAEALNEIGAKVIVMGTTANGTARREPYERIAELTGSVDAEGEPLIFATKREEMKGASGAQLVQSAIETLAAQTPLDLQAVARDLPGDDVDATQFIERIEADGEGEKADPRDAMRICVGGLSTFTGADGSASGFSGVAPGTPVCFTIIVAQNEVVPPALEPLVFRAAIDVQDPSGSTLDTREVFFLVPPKAPQPGEVIR